MSLFAIHFPELSNVRTRYTDDSGSESEDDADNVVVQDLNPPHQSSAAAPAPAPARNVRSDAPQTLAEVAVTSAVAAPIQPPSSAPNTGPARTCVPASPVFFRENMNRNRCPRISIQLALAPSCTLATHPFPVRYSF